MKRIFAPTKSGSDWQRLLAKPTLHWKKGASAMTTAACWESAHDRLPPEISTLLDSSRDLDLSQLALLVAIPEWQVPLYGGDRASQTDVLAVARNDRGLVVLAIEAKVNETFGPTLAEKRCEASSGQVNRLDYLHTLLGLPASLDGNIRYQLLHRTASALLTAQALHAHTAVMLVHSFSPEGRGRQDFDAFVSALGAQEMADGLLLVSGISQPRLFIGWCRGDQRFLSAELPAAPEYV
jgi:hypothetical protein